MGQQQRQYWTYAQGRDEAHRRSLQQNFTRLMSNFPNFLADILTPWAPTNNPTLANDKEDKQNDEDGA